MKTTKKKEGLKAPTKEKKLTPAEKKRVAILQTGRGMFKEEFEKGLMKPFVRK